MLKIDYFNYLLHFFAFDVVCITGTSNDDNKFCELSGCNVIRHDRTDRGGDIAF